MQNHGPFHGSLWEYRDQLPLTFRDQFLVDSEASYRIRMTGHMDRVWHRPGWIGPLLRLSTWIDLLFPETGTQVPATMVVSVERGRTGDIVHRWDRSFHFEATQRRFNAKMVYDHELGCVEERFIGDGFLCMSWDIRFEAPRTMTITTKRCSVRLRGRRLWLPSFLHPTVKAVETAAVDDPDRIRIELVMSHPWLGDIFGYEGEFRLSRESEGITTHAS